MRNGIIPRRMAEATQLLKVSEARHRLLDHFSRLEVEEIPLIEAVGRYMAEPFHSSAPLPAFDYSSMDGFAIRAEETAPASQSVPVEIVVVMDIPAGRPAIQPLLASQAARIMTGGAIPHGANAVAPVEITDFDYRTAGAPVPEKVRIFRAVKAGENIRYAGEDISAGTQVFNAGKKIRPQDAGLLSSLGCAFVRVIRKPRIGIFSSGDELLPVERQLTPGKIHDANMYILKGLVEQCGAEALNLGIVPDQYDQVLTTLERALELGVDLILSSAGVSVGALDVVRHVIEKDGQLEFWRVNMRPGKPLAFGAYRGTPLIGLPGNPVSAFVGFEVFVRPTLLKMMGSDSVLRPVTKVSLEEDIESDGRESYLRAWVREMNGEASARLAGHQSSGNLVSLAQANALLIIPSGVKSLPSGRQVEAWLLEQ